MASFGWLTTTTTTDDDNIGTMEDNALCSRIQNLAQTTNSTKNIGQQIKSTTNSQMSSQLLPPPSSNVRRRTRTTSRISTTDSLSSISSCQLQQTKLSQNNANFHIPLPLSRFRSGVKCRRSTTSSTFSSTSSSFKSSSSPLLQLFSYSTVLLLILVQLFSGTSSVLSLEEPANGAAVAAAGSIEAKKEWSTGHHHSSGGVVRAGTAVAAGSVGLIPRPRYRTLYACEGSSLEIVCEEGTHINLIRANFGRFSISVCNEHGNVEWSVDCMSHRSFRVIQDRCSGRSNCNLEASIATFGEDACPRVHKYLEVHFNCTAPRSSLSSSTSAALPSRGSNPNIVQLMSNNNNSPNSAQPQTATNSDNSGDDSVSSSQSIAESSAAASISNRGNHHHPSIAATLSPVIIFPEPLSPSGGQPEQQQHSVSTSTIIPPPRFVDLTPFDTKEAEEAAGANVGGPGPSISAHYPDGSIVVRPPHPSDFDSDSKTDDDDEDEDVESEEIPIVINSNRPSGAQYTTSTVPSAVLNNNNHHYPSNHQQHRPQVPPLHHSQVPTAKPPKPNQLDSELPSGEDGRVSFTSPSVNHHHNHPNHDDNEMVIEEEEVVVQPVMPSLDLLYNHCHAMFAKGINWNFTLAGSVAMQHCPGGAEGIARWSCIMEGAVPTWTPHLPDMSNCSSLWVTHLLSRIHSHRYPLLSLAEDLAKGAKGDILYSGDLIRAADIIKQLVMRLETLLEETKDDGQERRAHIIKELLNSVLKVASNLLEESKMESWHELSPQDQRLAIGSMTSALENVAQLLADVRTQSNYNYVRSHDNILVSVHVHPLSSLEHGMRLPWVLSQRESVNPSLTDAAPSEVSAYLPYESLVEHANDNGQVKVVFVLYRRLASLLKPRLPLLDSPAHLQPYAYHHYSPPQSESNNVDSFDPFVSNNLEQQPPHHHHLGHLNQFPARSSISVNTIVNSDVVGLIIASNLHHSSYDRLSTPLSAPLELTLRHLQTENVTNGRCAFWDIKRSDWSTSGCETVSSNQTHTVCRCNHLTNFAVLMDVSNVSFDSRNEFALKLITRIGCAISIVALLLTLITLSVYKSLNSIRNSIHKHLCACLLVAEIIFLFGIDETRVKLVCGLIAIALHYFFLSAFLWMFFEGLQLYTMLVQVFEHRHNRLTFYSLVAYGAPALLVIVAALVDPLSYGTSEHCWLRADNHFVWSFLGPALAVLLANALFLALAMSVMCRHSPTGMMNSASFAVHQKQQQQQQQLKVYPSPLTSASSYSITDHSKLTSIRIWVRTSLALVVVLGLTWTFGVLYLSHSTVYMAYTFTLLNSLQGLFIFIFCCLLNDKVRAEYRTTLGHGARHCFLLRPFEPSSLAFATKSSTDSTRSTSLRDSHHLMMASSPHHLSQQHLYMQQPAASFLGSRNAGPRTSLLYLNELLGKSEGPTAVNTPTADQPLITSQMMQQTPHNLTLSQQHLQQSLQQQQQQQSNLEPQHLSALQQAQLSQALSSLSQITLPDDASSSDYGCRRLTQMIEHIYECIDEDPYVAKLLLPAIQRSLANGGAVGTQVRTPGGGRGVPESGRVTSQLPPSILATLGRASQRDVNSSQPMRLQPNSSYLSSGNHTLHGGAHINGLHLPAIVRDNTAIQNGLKNSHPQGPIANGISLHHHHQQQILHQQQQQQQQQTVALLDGDQVRCCTLTDHKLCDHQTELSNGSLANGGQTNMERTSQHLMKSSRHHLASEC